MPLTAKGKKLKKKFREQYGNKKGDSIFYAMENSGKLKKVIKARGGDAAKADRAESRNAGRADERKGVDRSAVGEGSQFAKNQAVQNLQTQRKKTIQAISPSTTIGGQALKYCLMFSGVPFPGKITSGILDRGQNLGYGRAKKTNTKKIGGGGDGNMITKKILPVQATKPIDTNLIKPKDNFFNFISYKVGGLSGGVSYGPPPRKGPNSQVPPIKMKKGGLK